MVVGPFILYFAAQIPTVLGPALPLGANVINPIPESSQSEQAANKRREQVRKAQRYWYPYNLFARIWKRAASNSAYEKDASSTYASVHQRTGERSSSTPHLQDRLPGPSRAIGTASWRSAYHPGWAQHICPSRTSSASSFFFGWSRGRRRRGKSFGCSCQSFFPCRSNGCIHESFASYFTTFSLAAPSRDVNEPRGRAPGRAYAANSSQGPRVGIDFILACVILLFLHHTAFPIHGCIKSWRFPAAWSASA